MIAYIESNFVLELALLQAQCDACEAISVVEPYHTLIHRAKQRSDLQGRLSQVLGQLARTRPYRERIERSREVVTLLAKSGKEAKERKDFLRLTSRPRSKVTVVD